jgi:hypothetical protein
VDTTVALDGDLLEKNLAIPRVEVPTSERVVKNIETSYIDGVADLVADYTVRGIDGSNIPSFGRKSIGMLDG